MMLFKKCFNIIDIEDIYDEIINKSKNEIRNGMFNWETFKFIIPEKSIASNWEKNNDLRFWKSLIIDKIIEHNKYYSHLLNNILLYYVAVSMLKAGNCQDYSGWTIFQLRKYNFLKIYLIYSSLEDKSNCHYSIKISYNNVEYVIDVMLNKFYLWNIETHHKFIQYIYKTDKNVYTVLYHVEFSKYNKKLKNYLLNFINKYWVEIITELNIDEKYYFEILNFKQQLLINIEKIDFK